LKTEEKVTDLFSRHVIWKVSTQPQPLIKSSLASEKLLEEMIAAVPGRLRQPVAAVSILYAAFASPTNARQ
jgi:hypothetical protein